MNHLSSTLVLCDLDHLLLGADGNLTQVVRDVLQLFVRRGGRFTVFSQRTPRAVRSILGSVRLSAPALVCGGAMAYHFRWHPPAAVHLCRAGCRPVRPSSGGRGRGHCPADDRRYYPRAAHERGIGASSAAGMDPLSAGKRGRHQGGRSAAGAAVSGQQGSAHDLAAGKISGRPHSGAAGRACRSGYADPDPRTVSGREMLDAVCMPVGIDPEDVLVLAGGLPMLDMVRASSQSTAAADAPAELRLAAQKVTLTDAAAGSAVEVLYRMVRDAENLA